MWVLSEAEAGPALTPPVAGLQELQCLLAGPPISTREGARRGVLGRASLWHLSSPAAGTCPRLLPPGAYWPSGNNPQVPTPGARVGSLRVTYSGRKEDCGGRL